LFRFPASGAGTSLQLYVNRGLGTVGLPLRFNCRPEITLLTLSAEPA
jgi:predicted MPP superfamily phosphohydrolase